MEIHKIIQERRKALGLTQEQVAEYLGVTAPAVNKWEKGNSCPDVALLSPLARLLETDLNTLFGFYKDITNQELILFCREIQEVVAIDGIDAGFLIAREKIHKYPNSDILLHNFALLLQGLIITSGLVKEETERYMAEIDGWFKKLIKCNEISIRNSAYFMLASGAIRRGEYDIAQEYIDKMPERKDTPDKRMLQVNIFLEEGKAEDATRLLENMLFAAINEVQMIMYKLIDANMASGDSDAASYVAERTSKLAENFDLNQYNALVGPFMVAVANKDTEQTVILLKKMLTSMDVVWKVQDSPLYHKVIANESGVYMKNLIAPLLKELKESADYEFLQKNEEFQNWLAEQEGNILK